MSVKHCVVRTDKMFGTYNVAGLANVKISEELDNGSIVVIGALAEGEREAYVAEMPATDSALATLGLIAAPEVMADERLKLLSDFYNMLDANGGIVRAYRLHQGDEFSVTAEGLKGEPAVGATVNADAAYKMAVNGSGTKIGDIIAQEGDYWVIRVQG